MDEERGFTLVELLVVVGIVGILAAIAIPQYMGYKRSAVDSDMRSCLHAARTAMESFYGRGYTYAGATLPVLEAEEDLHCSTPGVQLSIVSATATDYAVRACATGGTTPAHIFSTATGQMVPDFGTCS